MGYEVHITRADEWSESESRPILPEEWAAVVAADPEMRLTGFAEARTPEGELLRVEAPGIAVWTGYSRHGIGGNLAWFVLANGHVSVKGPDEEILGKMRALAQRLGARVQGDEGESYDEAPPAPAPWWRRLLRPRT